MFGVQPELVAAMKAKGATILETPAATVAIFLHAGPSADDLLPISAAAEIAKTSTRTIKDAGRSGALTLLGGQRDRTVRRADLMAWIESRRARPAAGADDDDIARRMARLSKNGAKR